MCNELVDKLEQLNITEKILKLEDNQTDCVEWKEMIWL